MSPRPAILPPYATVYQAFITKDVGPSAAKTLTDRLFAGTTPERGVEYATSVYPDGSIQTEADYWAFISAIPLPPGTVPPVVPPPVIPPVVPPVIPPVVPPVTPPAVPPAIPPVSTWPTVTIRIVQPAGVNIDVTVEKGDAPKPP